MSAQAEDFAYALLTDGTTIEIRPARPHDFDAVRDMHAKMSPDNLYLRFFSLSPVVAEQEARRICREPGPDHAALLAVLDGEVVGCGTYEQAGAGSRSAEVAFTVADDLHNRGIGMLLLEHLVSLARGRGFRSFTAVTLSENAAMLRVFADAGLQAQRSLVDGAYEFTFPLPEGEADAALGTYRDTVAVRERTADVASMRPVLAPASVAVIGASRRPDSVGRAILRNIITGGFPGPVYPVNPHAADLDGIPCLPSAAALPEQVDLAVIAVPSAAVLGIAEDCGRRGVKALVVIAAGLSGPARAELLGICRRHGMRMVGPASFGVANPGIGLDATFAARHPAAGTAGLALQSTGGTGFVLRGAPVPAGRGDLYPGLLRRQRRRVRHRHAAVVGGRQGDEAGPAIRGIDREPAQVCPHLPSREPHDTGADRGRGPVRDRQAAGRGPRRQGGYPAGHQAGPVRADGRDCRR